MESTDSRRPEPLCVPSAAQQEAPAAPPHWQQRHQPPPEWPTLAAVPNVWVPGIAPHRGPAQARQQAQHSQQQQQQQASALRAQRAEHFMASRESYTQLHVRDSQPQRQHGNDPRSHVHNNTSALEAMAAAPALQAQPQQAFKPVRVASMTSTQASAIGRCVDPRSVCPPQLRLSS